MTSYRFHLPSAFGFGAISSLTGLLPESQCFRFGNKCQLPEFLTRRGCRMTAPLQNGGAVPLHTRAPAPAYASGSAQGRQIGKALRGDAAVSKTAERGSSPRAGAKMPSAAATLRTLSDLVGTAPASSGAPISGAGDFLECQVLRLILLTDLHQAKRAHRPTARIVKRLRDVTARLAAQ